MLMSFKKLDPTQSNASVFPKILLIYGYNQEELAVLLPWLEKIHASYLIIDSSATGMTVEEILKQEPINKSPIHVSQQKTIVLSGYSQKDLYDFVQSIKTLSLKRPILATVTPTSVKWPFGQLVKELMLEHAQMSKKSL